MLCASLLFVALWAITVLVVWFFGLRGPDLVQGLFLYVN